MVNPVDLKQKACEDVVKDPNEKEMNMTLD